MRESTPPRDLAAAACLDPTVETLGRKAIGPAAGSWNALASTGAKSKSASRRMGEYKISGSSGHTQEKGNFVFV